MFRLRVTIVNVSSLNHVRRTFSRSASSASAAASSKGLVLGVYDPPSGSSSSKQTAVLGTQVFHEFDKNMKGVLTRGLITTGYFDRKIKRAKTRLFHGLDQEYGTIVVVGLGAKEAGFNELEQYDEDKENIRAASAAAAKQLQDLGCREADLDTFGDDQSAAEGSHLQLFSFDQLKEKSKRKEAVILTPIASQSSRSHPKDKWNRGVTLAEGQNYARTLMETPSNLKAPKDLAARISADLSSVPGLSVIIRDEKFAEQKKMGAFLAVSRGSDEPLRLLEISYRGVPATTDVHCAVVGKGVTFDTGGISLKPSLHMDLMRGDMGGAACTAASILTAAKLKLPINLVGIMPICENMPSGSATRPGDVVFAMNGKSIQIDNTDAEGRLILADALCYAQEFNPKFIMDLATLTGAIRVALGSAAAGIFTNDSRAYGILQDSAAITGDRVWRMPLFKHFSAQMTDCHLADINNVGKHSPQGGACTAAAFLREFVRKEFRWMHMDIAGVSENKDEVPYLRKGFTGRPTRTLVEFYRRLGLDSPV